MKWIKNSTFARRKEKNMKKFIMSIAGIILLLALIPVSVFNCSNSTLEKESIEGDTVIVAPDSVWDTSYVDSITQRIKAASYNWWGDSDAYYYGAPDSIMKRKAYYDSLQYEQMKREGKCQ